MGLHTVTPRIVVEDVRTLVAFVRDVFGATGELTLDRPTVLAIGDAQIMISGTNPLGLHRVTVHAIDGTRLQVGPLEAIDGTPIVDLKIALSYLHDD